MALGRLGDEMRRPSANRRTLLLAEDDACLARLMTTRLGIEGWDVNAVDRGHAVLAQLELEQPDVVALDLRLPDIDGLELLERISGLPCPPPVIVISGHLDLQATLGAIRRGASEVLEKPVEPPRLIEILNRLTRPARAEAGHREMIGRSPAIARLREQISGVAHFGDVPVMIMGESGTGKELVARSIHHQSGATTRMVSINCAAMPESLFESELFGHVSGSFTGARGARIGLLEAAGSGTVFLDEVGGLAPGLQSKLLRVLETRSFRRLGSNEEVSLRARIVSATNRELRGLKSDPMRQDLYFRLAGYTLRTPPLRERLEDIEPLTQHFLETFRVAYPAAPVEVSPEAIDALCCHDWPGNVRQLRAVLQSALIQAEGDVLRLRHVAQALQANGCLGFEPAKTIAPDSGTDSYRDVARESGIHERFATGGLPEVERSVIIEAFTDCEGNLSRAARRLKIPRTTLRDKLRRYGLR